MPSLNEHLAWYHQTDTARDYVRIATDLAAHPNHLADLRTRLRPLMAASSLCNAQAFARPVEHAYRTRKPSGAIGSASRCTRRPGCVHGTRGWRRCALPRSSAPPAGTPSPRAFRPWTIFLPADATEPVDGEDHYHE